mmetsp:Transcript_19554/g.56953  ORF Transcript_19554/g.56953 Transcript_19554/m.56953 type:complete len:209 (-) Transcript_19554:2-628(-)
MRGHDLVLEVLRADHDQVRRPPRRVLQPLPHGPRLAGTGRRGEPCGPGSVGLVGHRLVADGRRRRVLGQEHLAVHGRQLLLGALLRGRRSRLAEDVVHQGGACNEVLDAQYQHLQVNLVVCRPAEAQHAEDPQSQGVVELRICHEQGRGLRFLEERAQLTQCPPSHRGYRLAGDRFRRARRRATHAPRRAFQRARRTKAGAAGGLPLA